MKQRQFQLPEHDLSADFSGQISVFFLSQIDPRLSEESVAVVFDRTDVVGILMGDQNMLDLLRIQIQPGHLLLQPFVVVSRIDHDRRTVLRIEEDIGDILPDTGDVFVDPTRVQRFKGLLPPIEERHELLLHM